MGTMGTTDVGTVAKNNNKMATPRKNPKDKLKVGRKLFDGKDEQLVLKKLEEAFAFGASDLEACFYADISTAALYAYQKNNPEFLLRKEKLKERPVLIARQSVLKQMSTDGDLALKYLERKKKDEFSTKTEVENTGTIEIQQTKEKLKSLFKKK